MDSVGMPLLCQVDQDHADADDWDGLQAALNWQPDPVELGLVQGSLREGNSDIITMLVSVYGTKELFINEYRCLDRSPATRAVCDKRAAFMQAMGELAMICLAPERELLTPLFGSVLLLLCFVFLLVPNVVEGVGLRWSEHVSCNSFHTVSGVTLFTTMMLMCRLKVVMMSLSVCSGRCLRRGCWPRQTMSASGRSEPWSCSSCALERPPSTTARLVIKPLDRAHKHAPDLQCLL